MRARSNIDLVDATFEKLNTKVLERIDIALPGLLHERIGISHALPPLFAPPVCQNVAAIASPDCACIGARIYSANPRENPLLAEDCIS